MNAGASTAKPPSERVVFGDIVDGLNAESDKLCDLAGVNSGQFQDVIFRKWRIAVVKKFAGDWIVALRSGGDLRSFCHPEHTKL